MDFTKEMFLNAVCLARYHDLDTLRSMQDRLPELFATVGKHPHSIEDLQRMELELADAVDILAFGKR